MAIPFVLARIYFRAVKEPDYSSDLSHRFGGFRASKQGMIWIHAVSAGETIAAVPLIKRLLDQGHECIVTNMTPTGRDRVRVLLGESVENGYAPYDLPGAIQRFIENNRPIMLAVVDTELWPNMIHGCAEKGIPVVIVNARMSERSAKGYQRIYSVASKMLRACRLILTQTEQHANRFRSLGALPSQVHVTGSIKFDGEFSQGYSDRVNHVRELIGARRVLLGASTHEGEEAPLLALLPRLRETLPDVLLVLAPRHTHRCDRVESLCEAAGEKVIRSTGVEEIGDSSVLLIDEMGALEAYYSIADVALVGGSLVPVGGHNLLEAVRSETAVVMGPHLDNVEDITAQFQHEGGMVVVEDSIQLEDAVIEYMNNDEKTLRVSGFGFKCFGKKPWFTRRNRTTHANDSG